MRSLLIANRGEIAIRVARTASVMGVRTIGVYSEDDATALHTRMVDHAVPLGEDGPAAYLDAERIVDIAAANGCDAIHPGYGFLSEQGRFCRICEGRGVIFVGPTAASLDLFGDKVAARAFAEQCGIPTPRGLSRPVTFGEAHAFFEQLGDGRSVMLKAVAGGGGRGMRPVDRLKDLERAFERCSSEALRAFGSGGVYIEELLPRARHVEVQIIGDGAGGVSHLWDRECSLQRQRQKLVEIAPAIALPEQTRRQMLEAALRLARAAQYRGVGTVEFLVDASAGGGGRFVFIEANARLQVEHTVTEEILGLDLVRAQLELARGASLAHLGLEQAKVGEPRGVAIEARINLETIDVRGAPRPSSGVVSVYEPPAGPGVRVDGAGYAGYAPSNRFDSLLAKLVVHAESLPTAVGRMRRALREFRIGGVRTNIPFLEALFSSEAIRDAKLHTRFIEENAAALLDAVVERS